MAMLAEKKIKRVKLSVNPNGNDWAKDENKFGQRLLQKMGWEPGTGLGANRQGITEIVKVRMKHNMRGFGERQIKDSEAWIKQQEDFDKILGDLSGRIGDKEEKGIISSLEEKSKTSKTRVHYHKFTRGKDISRYSAKDLNSIIGVSSSKRDEEESVSDVSANMYHYFKSKQNKTFQTNESEIYKEGHLSNGDLNNDDNRVCDVECQPVGVKITKKKRNKKSIESSVIENIDGEEVKKKRKKRSTKVDEQHELEEKVINSVEEMVDSNENDVTRDCDDEENFESINLKKNKKKRKNQSKESEPQNDIEEINIVNDIISNMENHDDTDEFKPLKTKKKKKKSNK